MNLAGVESGEDQGGVLSKNPSFKEDQHLQLGLTGATLIT